MYTTLFMGKVCRKNPGFDKDKTDVMFGLTVWLCIFHFPLCTSQGIKVPFENKVMGLAHRSLVSPCHSFFLFPPFLSLFFFQDDSLEHRSFIGFLCKSRKIKPCSRLCYPYRLSHHPEGTPGSCWGWTLAGACILLRYSLVAQMVKNLPVMREVWVNSWVHKIPWRRKWQPTPVFLPEKSHGWRRLTGYSP